MTMEGLGERIEYLRKETGYSQPALAAEIGVSNSVISFWENNVNEPKATYIKLLAEVFNVSTDYLLGITEENFQRPIPRKQINGKTIK